MSDATHRTPFSAGAGFLADLIGFAPGKLAGLFALLLARGVSESCTFVLLIPLLELAGVVPQVGAADRISSALKKALAGIGVTATLELVLGLFVVLMALRALLGYAAAKASSRLLAAYQDSLRQRLYTSFSRASWRFLSGTRQAHDIHALTMQTDSVGAAALYAVNLAAGLMMALAGVTVALVISPALTLIVLAGLLLIALPMTVFQRWAYARGAASMSAMQKLYDAITQRMAGIKLAKAFAIERELERDFAGSSAAYAAAVAAADEIQARAALIQQTGAALILVAFIYGGLAMLGASSVELVVLIAIFARLMPLAGGVQSGLQGLVAMLPEHASLMQAEARARAHAEQLPDATEPMALDEAIELRDVAFSYDGDGRTWAVRDVSLRIPAHTAVGLIGLSGAGKSTLADLIAGLLHPSRGSVHVDGRRIDDANRYHWRRSVAYVPQDAPLFQGTLRDNLLIGARHAGEDDIWRCLDIAGAAELVRRLPAGLETLAGDRGVRFSGGERQRLRLASALLRQPRLLVLDEATSALNPVDEHAVLTRVRELLEHMTIIVIAHRTSSVAWTDQLIVLHDGAIVHAGHPSVVAARREGLIGRMQADASLDARDERESSGGAARDGE